MSSKTKYIDVTLVKNLIKHTEANYFALDIVDHLPSIEIGRCGNCKFFEPDSVARVDGIPLIVAHEICRKWGDGCKTRENGWCFLFEEAEKCEK